MELSIKKKETPLRVLFYTWKDIPHSYGICSAFLLIHLYLNYGPNGKIKKNAIDIYVEEADYYNPTWNNIKKLVVYTPEYNEILQNLKQWTQNTQIDLIYRQTYPYNINITNENKDIPKCVFYTSEFSALTSDYFTLQKPTNINNSQYDAYIQLFLEQFQNIYFTAPSEWSAKGMRKYIKDDSRNRIITHGVDTKIFKKHSDNVKRNEVRKHYNINDNDILLINIGAMTSNKGILLFLEALHILVNKQNKTQYKLMLKGSEDLYTCKHFVEQYFEVFKTQGIMTQDEIDNLFKHIIFTNKTLSFEKINDLFNASDLYISPYLAEGFGLTMLEALAAGLRVLVPKTGSTEKYISDIYTNNGQDHITFVNSHVITENGLSQNNITVDDLLTSINNINFTTQPSNYDKMITFINEKLSWSYASTLLFDYFKDICYKRSSSN